MNVTSYKIDTILWQGTVSMVHHAGYTPYTETTSLAFTKVSAQIPNGLRLNATLNYALGFVFLNTSSAYWVSKISGVCIAC